MGSVSVALLAAIAATADPATGDPSLDVEAELKRIASAVPPPSLEVRYAPLEGGQFVLDEVAIELDGRPQRAPGAASARAGGTLFSGPVEPGRHEITVRLTLVADLGPSSYRTGYRFRLGKRISLEARRGLAHQVEITPQREPSLGWEQSLGLAARRSERMTAALETGDMLAPPPRQYPAPQQALAAEESGSGNKVNDEEATPAAQPVAVLAAAPSPSPKPAIARDPAPSKPAPVRTSKILLQEVAVRAKHPEAAEPSDEATPAAIAERAPALEAPAGPAPTQAVTMVQALTEAAQAPRGAAPAPARAPAAKVTTVWPGALAGTALLAAAIAVALRRRHKASPPSTGKTA